MDDNDHDLLIRIDERTTRIEARLHAHLTQHEKRNGWEKRMLMMMLTAVITALGSLAVTLAK